MCAIIKLQKIDIKYVAVVKVRHSILSVTTLLHRSTVCGGAWGGSTIFKKNAVTLSLKDVHKTDMTPL